MTKCAARRDNLRLVCPNCDSQLPTFKARNRPQGRAWRKQRYADGKPCYATRWGIGGSGSA